LMCLVAGFYLLRSRDWTLTAIRIRLLRHDSSSREG
jgi:hypothetical protein